MKIQRKLKKTSRALWVILLTGVCAPVWAIPASSYLLVCINKYEIPTNFFTLFVIFSIPVYIGAFSDQFVEWLWSGFQGGTKKRGVISRAKMITCFCVLGVTLLVGVPVVIASVRNFSYRFLSIIINCINCLSISILISAIILVYSKFNFR